VRLLFTAKAQRSQREEETRIGVQQETEARLPIMLLLLFFHSDSMPLLFFATFAPLR